MGSQNAFGVRSFYCPLPCRSCMIEKKDLWSICSANPLNDNYVRPRCSTGANFYLENAFDVYCKKLRRADLTIEERDILDYCTRFSIHPIKMQFLKVSDPIENFSAYLTCPADKMHTVLAGLFRDWIVYVVVICT